MPLEVRQFIAAVTGSVAGVGSSFMQRLPSTPRPNWQRPVEEQGLVFHTTDTGKPYWDESALYAFSASEIDTLEAAIYALDKLCLQAVKHIVSNGRFEDFQVPPGFVPWLCRSWEEDEQTIYGRFDLLYDGTGPPKLIEFNADTPTALLEAAVVQWYWLKDVAPDAD
jgi:glutathionylspermidine synthase